MSIKIALKLTHVENEKKLHASLSFVLHKIKAWAVIKRNKRALSLQFFPIARDAWAKSRRIRSDEIFGPFTVDGIVHYRANEDGFFGGAAAHEWHHIPWPFAYYKRWIRCVLIEPERLIIQESVIKDKSQMRIDKSQQSRQHVNCHFELLINYIWLSNIQGLFIILCPCPNRTNSEFFSIKQLEYIKLYICSRVILKLSVRNYLHEV